MAMGIVSDQDYEKELQQNGERLQQGSTNIQKIELGRPPNKTEVPEIIREEAAKSIINGEGTAKQVSEAFGISQSSLSAYKVGATSTASYNSPDPTLLDKINDHKLRTSSKARKVLMRALAEITDDKLTAVKPRDLAAIAKDMSSIVQDMEPRQVQSNSSVQFVFMAPRVKELSDYRIIDVKD